MGDNDHSLLRFPCARVSPSRSVGGTRELGIGALARQLEAREDHLNGHWCSRCKGIWYGFLLEVECPVCGNRSG